MDKLLFKKGNSVNLPQIKEEGTFYLVEDKKEIHINDIILKNSDDIEHKLSDSYQEVEYNAQHSNLFTPASKGQTLDEAIHSIDSNVATLVDETIKNEKVVASAFVNVKDAVGLDENLNYIADNSTNYISDATSLSKADSLLDEAIKNVSDKVATLEKSGYDDTELKNLISDNTNSINQLINEKQDKNLGEYNEVMYPEVVSDKFMSINKDMTVNEAIHTVESNVATLVDETIKNETVTANAITFIKESVGLNDNLNYESNIDTVYISDATSFAEADSLLDKAIKSTNDRIDSLGELEFDDTELKGLINELQTSKQNVLINEYEEKTYPVIDDIEWKQVSNGNTITVAINNIEDNLVTLIDETIKNEEVVAQVITTIKDSIGLNDNIQYEPNENAVYISGATSLIDADSLLDEAISSKQDVISDLENIRSGAALGATALQTVPEGYVTLSDLESLIGVATDDDINNIFN